MAQALLLADFMDDERMMGEYRTWTRPAHHT